MTRIRFYLPAIAWTIIVLLMTLLPASDIPNTFFSKIPYFDKMVHAGIFGLFVILWYAGSHKSFTSSASPERVRSYHPLTMLAVVILAAVILGLVIEIIQKEWTVIHRDFEWFDWIADIFGAFFGGAVANEIFKIKPASQA